MKKNYHPLRILYFYCHLVQNICKIFLWILIITGCIFLLKYFSYGFHIPCFLYQRKIHNSLFLSRNYWKKVIYLFYCALNYNWPWTVYIKWKNSKDHLFSNHEAYYHRYLSYLFSFCFVLFLYRICICILHHLTKYLLWNLWNSFHVMLYIFRIMSLLLPHAYRC